VGTIVPIGLSRLERRRLELVEEILDIAKDAMRLGHFELAREALQEIERSDERLEGKPG
jgi:phage shock protein A